MADAWLPTLITETPQTGYELALHLARLAVKFTQPSAEVREKLREGYANDFNSLIEVSEVVAINFQTVAAANHYWRK
jgi:Hexameric tyrosine-coordinated heme protein (HTHP)